MDSKQFREWRDDPRTQEVMQFLADYRLSLMEAWAQGCYSFPEMQASAIKTAEALAKVQCYQDVSELDFETIRQFYSKEEKSND